MLGRQVMKALAKDTYELRGLCSTRLRDGPKVRDQPKLVPADLTIDDAPRKLIEEFNPQIVINLVAQRQPDAVERNPEEARKVNVDLVRRLADACTSVGAWLLQISTDYVFDGTKPPYSVHDTPNPLNTYGKQKWEAEKLVEERAVHGAILRIPLLYGPMEFYNESSVTSLYASILSGTLVKADDLQKRYPAHTEDVAEVVRRMVQVRLQCRERLTGYFHWQGRECLTKYQMIQGIGAARGIDISGVEPDKVAPAWPRPEDSSLDISRLEELLGGKTACEDLHIPFVKALKKIFSDVDAQAAEK